QNAQNQSLGELLLAKIHDRDLQKRMEDFAGGFDPGNGTVLQRRKRSTYGKVESWKEREADGTHQQAEGVKPADGRRAKAGGNQPGDQHHVFAGLPALVT